MVRNCIECGDRLLGRSDKKYCCDGCRNSYNNRVNGYSGKSMRLINSILRKNRRILEELFREHHYFIHKHQLDERGFNFNYVTHQRPIEKGMLGKFCYDFGYTINEKESIMLVQEPELKSYSQKELLE